jgi:hypothetical protein
MKFFFGGSRHWVEQRPIEDVILNLPRNSIIIEGDAPGVDRIAGYCADLHGHRVRKYPALAGGRKWPWAGPVRNQEMIDKEHLPDDPIYRAYLLHEDPGLGKGTKDMLSRLVVAEPEIEIWIKIRKNDWYLHRRG